MCAPSTKKKKSCVHQTHDRENVYPVIIISYLYPTFYPIMCTKRAQKVYNLLELSITMSHYICNRSNELNCMWGSYNFIKAISHDIVGKNNLCRQKPTQPCVWLRHCVSRPLLNALRPGGVVI